MASPIPQKSRPIGLTLFDGAFIRWAHIFFLRPEEIVYTHPSRGTTVQTLGGAWVDSWGEGLIEVQLNGHTGWRGSFNIPGELQLYNIREMVFRQYHRLRRQFAQSNRDPNLIELILADTLNAYAATVYPVSFQLRRHKTRPLLYQYQIRLVVLRNFVP